MKKTNGNKMTFNLKNDQREEGKEKEKQFSKMLSRFAC
jgi:hypothetical protein